MCGICGIGLADPSARVDPNELECMSRALVHRGPDEAGAFIGSRAGLASRRLSIIDLDGGSQPITNEQETLQLVSNGEVYNFRGLRTTLESRGHLFRTQSDTEVAVHAYEEWGENFLNHLRGMFGLAIWDSAAGTLLLAVDRFGIKPLYYSYSPSGIRFASELRGLLAAGGVDRGLDYSGLAQYFTLGYIPHPRTVFEGVRKIQPGTMLRWRAASNTVEIERYWEPQRREPVERSLQGTRRDLRECLRDAVESHLVSDVPVGAFLSGGIDSSIVVALMSEVAGGSVKTFSIGFSDRAYNELPYARLVARHFGTEHHEIVIEPQSVDLLPRLVDHFGEPFADPAALPTYAVSQLAREHVKVALSGDGGDELFVGYSTYRGVELARQTQRLPARLRRTLSAVRPPHVGRPAIDHRLELFAKRVRDTAFPPEEAYRRKISSGALGADSAVFTTEFRTRLAASNPFAAVDAALARGGGTPLERVLGAGMTVSLPGDMLVKVDRMSMANSLEVRVPFLDHLLAEFVYSVPLHRLAPRGRLKGLLKDTMADSLPPAILSRRKHGFDVPLRAWFREDLAAFASEVLLDVDARNRGFLDPRATESLVRSHREGRTDAAGPIWKLLMFELWWRSTI